MLSKPTVHMVSGLVFFFYVGALCKASASMSVPSLHSRRTWIEEMVRLRVLGFLFRVCMPVLEGLAIEELLWYATALGGLQKKELGHGMSCSGMRCSLILYDSSVA